MRIEWTAAAFSTLDRSAPSRVQHPGQSITIWSSTLDKDRATLSFVLGEIGMYNTTPRGKIGTGFPPAPLTPLLPLQAASFSVRKYARAVEGPKVKCPTRASRDQIIPFVVKDHTLSIIFMAPQACELSRCENQYLDCPIIAGQGHQLTYRGDKKSKR
ncbi:hypothetical protein FKM82_016056 [Ascaphus truei]